jgi:Zn-dependent M28 family amino/carboxypeptidase
MIRMSHLRVLVGLPFLLTLLLGAQARHTLLGKQTIQQRLGLYKGDDSTREVSLLGMFKEAGCQGVNLSEQPVPRQKQPNIICVLAGTTPGIIVVGAHFDHVPRGDGIIDNWSGAALLPSLYQSLAGNSRKHTFVFVGFTGEEDELRGSEFYVKSLSKDKLSNIEAMINLDTLGLGPTEVWVSQSDPLLVNRLILVARSLNAPLTGMNVNGFGRSDEESFIRKKVCAITVHSVRPQTAHILHSHDDNAAAIRFEDYYGTYSLLAVYLTVLDTAAAQPDHQCKVDPL